MSSSPHQTEWADILSKHWLFGHLDSAELARVMRHTRLQKSRANEVIFRKGDPGLSMMAVLKGRVKISTASPIDREVVLNIIDEGEVFGEIAILDGEERTADATAMEPTELLVLDRRDFVPVLERNPQICMKLIHVLCRRLRNTSGQLEDTVFLVQGARLAKTILRLAREYGEPTKHGLQIGLKLSQRELGTLVGMRREALNRQLARWRDEGLVSIVDGRITISDPEEFERATEDLIWCEPE